MPPYSRHTSSIGSPVVTGDTSSHSPSNPRVTPILGMDSINSEYMQFISQYQGTPYYELLKNNPFLIKEGEYTPDWWEESIVQGLFNDYSKQNNFYAERRQSLYDEAYKILGEKVGDSYNSPLAKVQRDNAAGLNSDLLGVQAADSTIAPGTDDTPPTWPEPQDAAEKSFSFISGVSQAVQSCFHSLFDYGRMFGDLRGQSLDNAMKDFLLNSKAYETVLDQVTGADSFVVGEDGKELDTDSVFEQIQDSLVSGFGKGLSTKRAQKLYKYLTGVITHDKDNRKSLAYQRKRAEKVADFVDKQTKSVQGAGRFGFDEDFDQFLSAFSERFGSVMDDLFEKSNKFELDYYGKRSGETKALAENAADQYNLAHDTVSIDGQPLGQLIGEAEGSDALKAKAVNTFYEAIEKDFKDVESWLNEADQKGKWYAGISKTLLPYLKAMVIRVFNSSFGINFNRANSGRESFNNGQNVYNSSSQTHGSFSF